MSRNDREAVSRRFSLVTACLVAAAGLLIGLIGIIALLGYLNDVSTLYPIRHFSSITVLTAVLLAAFSAAGLAISLRDADMKRRESEKALRLSEQRITPLIDKVPDYPLPNA